MMARSEPVEPILGKSARNLPQAEWALLWVNGGRDGSRILRQPDCVIEPEWHRWV
jgi:hypothetical protein